MLATPTNASLVSEQEIILSAALAVEIMID
jgi:hypothetical protein